MHIDLGGLHRIVLIMNRRGRAGEIVDFIDFQVKRESDVVSDQLKIRIVQKMNNIALGTGIKIVDAHHIAILG
jgi:hypothetical protein